MYSDIIKFIRKQYDTPNEPIFLHEPRFIGNERKYVLDAIDSTFVSSVGKYVNRFEAMMAEITGAKYAIALVNGTCALHIALKLVGVKKAQISKIENSTTDARFETILKVFKALNAKVSFNVELLNEHLIIE